MAHGTNLVVDDDGRLVCSAPEIASDSVLVTNLTRKHIRHWAGGTKCPTDAEVVRALDVVRLEGKGVHSFSTKTSGLAEATVTLAGE